LSWTIMAVPMSVVRIAMHDLGYTQTNSIRVMELHFLGMFGTGFISGALIEKFGQINISVIGFTITLASLLFNVAAPSSDISEGSTIIWTVGMILLGIGWNFGFTAATVWITKLYAPATLGGDKSSTSPLSIEPVDIEGQPGSDENRRNDVTFVAPSPDVSVSFTKNEIQSTNDFFMFMVGGMWTVSSGYIYAGGGSGLDGWRTLNYIVIGLLFLYCSILGEYVWSQRSLKF
jgi:hypothetical protein